MSKGKCGSRREWVGLALGRLCTVTRQKKLSLLSWFDFVKLSAENELSLEVWGESGFEISDMESGKSSE